MLIWDEIVKVAAANGLWALLFVALLFYQLQDSRKREIKYQRIIESLSNSLKTLDDVREDVIEIKANTAKCEKKIKSVRKEVINES